jgi:hypothetical protein
MMIHILIRSLQLIGWASLVAMAVLFVVSLFSIEVSMVLGIVGLVGGAFIFLVFLSLAVLLTRVDEMSPGSRR